jgi:hypothetical protein
VTRCSVTFDAQFDQYYCVHSIRTYFGSLIRSDRSQRVSDPYRNAATSVTEQDNLHIYSSVQTSHPVARPLRCFLYCRFDGTVDGTRPQNLISYGRDWSAKLSDLSICEFHWQMIMGHLDVLADSSHLHIHIYIEGFEYILYRVPSGA